MVPVRDVAEIGAAADDPPLSVCRAFRIAGWRVGIPLEPLRVPFPDLASHLLETETVRCVAFHRSGRQPAVGGGVAGRKGALPEIGMMPAPSDTSWTSFSPSAAYPSPKGSPIRKVPPGGSASRWIGRAPDVCGFIPAGTTSPSRSCEAAQQQVFPARTASVIGVFPGSARPAKCAYPGLAYRGGGC